MCHFVSTVQVGEIFVGALVGGCVGKRMDGWGWKNEWKDGWGWKNEWMDG